MENSRSEFASAGAPCVEPWARDPDHHLWRNGRLWWVAFTVHLARAQVERVRRSLGTDDLELARVRRDKLFARYPEERGCTLSLRRNPRPRNPTALLAVSRGG